MQDNANYVLPAPKRTPWNKGKLTGAKPPLRPKHVWSIGPNSKLRDKPGTWRCLTWLSTANYVAAMSSPSRSRMLLRADTPYRATVRQKKTGQYDICVWSAFPLLATGERTGSPSRARSELMRRSIQLFDDLVGAHQKRFRDR